MQNLKRILHRTLCLGALLTSQAAAQVVHPADLVMWLPLDSTNPGENLYPGGVDGVLGGSPLPGGGIVHEAICFDGIDDRVEVTDPLTSVGVDDFSIVAWIKQDIGASQFPASSVVEKRHWIQLGNITGYSLYTRGGMLGFQAADGPHSNFEIAPLTQGEWTLAAATVDRDNSSPSRLFSLAISGSHIVPFDVSARSGSLSSNVDLTIGHQSPATQYVQPFKGKIDEVALFHRALEPCEIQAIFDAGPVGMRKSRVLPTIHTNECPGNPWSIVVPPSTGGPAMMSVTGGTDPADDNVILRATCLPAHQFGFFITSEVTGFVANPAGSQGNLCLGNPIGHFSHSSQIVNSGPHGQATLDTTLGHWTTSAIPNPAGTYAATIGLPHPTSYFQFWYRTGSSGSNFSSSVKVDWGS